MHKFSDKYLKISGYSEKGFIDMCQRIKAYSAHDNLLCISNCDYWSRILPYNKIKVSNRNFTEEYMGFNIVSTDMILTENVFVFAYSFDGINPITSPIFGVMTN